MEVYVLLGLASVGYLFYRKPKESPANAPVVEASKAEVDMQLPMRRRYEQTLTVSDVRTREMIAAQSTERAARYSSRGDPVRTQGGKVRSDMAGVEFEREDFEHNNMQPYYSGQVKGPSADTAGMLERFSPVDIGRSKSETPAMFSPSYTSVQTVSGNQTYSESVQERIEDMNALGSSRRNETPFEAVSVGPGVGQGFTSTGRGGVSHNEDREYAMMAYKTVDELRPGNKPKISMEGRINHGAAPTQVPLVGELASNRPPTSFDVGKFSLPAPAAMPVFALRPDPTDGRAAPERPSYSQLQPPTAARFSPTPSVDAEGFTRELPHRTEMSALGVGTAYQPGKPDQRDGWHSPLDNERTVSDRGHVIAAGPPSAPVPAVDLRQPAPLRLSGKEATISPPSSHRFGMMWQGPGMGAVHSYSDRAHTTVRETTSCAARPGNYANERSAPGQAGDDTRRTIRESSGGERFDAKSFINMRDGVHTEGVGAPSADPRDHDPGQTARSASACSAKWRPGGAVMPVRPAINDETVPAVTMRDVIAPSSPHFGPAVSADSRPGNALDYLRANATSFDSVRYSSGPHFGGARSSVDRAPQYEAVYNSTLNDAKQAILETRPPAARGPNAVASTAAAGAVSSNNNRVSSGTYTALPNMPKRRLDGEPETSVRPGVGLHYSDRVDPVVLGYLKTNPFVIPRA